MLLKNIDRNKVKRFWWKGNFHRNSFIIILLIASIPGLITGLCIYWFGVGKVEDELRASNASQIVQRAKNMDEQFQYIEEYTTHWVFEPRFGEALKNIDFVKQYNETYDVTKTLSLLQGSHNLISNDELYLDLDQPILFKPQYNILDEKQKAFYHSLLSKGIKLHWVEYTQTKGQRSPALAFVSPIPITSKEPFGALIVTIDHKKALQLLKTLTPYENGAAVLLNDQNNVILSSNSTNQSNFINVLKKEIEKHKENSGSFSFKYNSSIYSISFGHFTRINSNWTYVSAAPMSSITAPIVFVSRLIIIISSSALILAIILSWFTSIKLYAPVRKLVRNLVGEETDSWNQAGKDEFSIIEQQWREMSQKSDLLQDRLSEQLTDLKDSFIFQLVQGYLFHYDDEDLRQRMETYGWNVKNRSFIALDIQLTGLTDSKENFSTSDDGLFTFMAANIMEEFAKEMFEQFNVINFSDLSVGMLVIYHHDDSIREKLHRFAENVTEAVNRIIKLQVTITISERTESIKKIPYIFEEVRTGKRLRTFENINQVIDLEEYKNSKNNIEFHYPFATEKEIIQAIRMGQLDEIEVLIKKFTQELTCREISEIYIQQAVIQLYSSIQHEILHSGIHPNDLFEGKNMFEELSQIRDVDRINLWFINDVISPYIQRLEGRMNIELKRIIEQVVTKINENYMYDISLESCADEVGTNPYSLSKAFKQIVGINFIDYLTQQRIEKAKELLIHSDMKINDIAEGVGYRHSYFNRIFKKQIGIPPSQFRKLNQDIN
ncbi:AraC family transcriptional regulator [Bacillus sp. USDA818B3_A]|uniref:AraC family transcriptional regulator n=1 Tax=Bacillus sp. USDA818B3_A TaxID=2698834 RepID=UPI00136DB5CB|nr:AraC family transcriptional regulator [Bacillus sp. USDA818B3_A]